MNDIQSMGASAEQLVAALKSKEPDGLSAVFDAYADYLFRYCWFLLRNRDNAQEALRDAMVAAQGQIGQLADPGVFTSWLYALARAECDRRWAVPAAEADEPPARPGQADAGSRLMAWHAVTSMDAAETEALYLTCLQHVDLKVVLGLSDLAVCVLLDRARLNLKQALAAEIWVSRGGSDCPDRAEVMDGGAGPVTPQLRERVLGHVTTCPVCGPGLPQSVSAAKVFAKLPTVSLPYGARERILAFAAEPPTSLIAERAEAPRERGSRTPVLAVAGATAAVAAAVASLIALGAAHEPRDHGLTNASAADAAASAPLRGGTGNNGQFPVPARPARAPSGARSAPHGAGKTAVVPFTRLTKPVRRPHLARPFMVPERGVSAPAVAAPAGKLTVTPGVLVVGPGGQGEVVLTAQGAAQAWTASTSAAEVSVSGDHGILAAGQSTTLVVTIHRTGAYAGTALIFLDQGTPATQTIRVFWSGQFSQFLPSRATSNGWSPPGSPVAPQWVP